MLTSMLKETSKCPMKGHVIVIPSLCCKGLLTYVTGVITNLGCVLNNVVSSFDEMRNVLYTLDNPGS